MLIRVGVPAEPCDCHSPYVYPSLHRIRFGEDELRRSIDFEQVNFECVDGGCRFGKHWFFQFPPGYLLMTKSTQPRRIRMTGMRRRPQTTPAAMNFPVVKNTHSKLRLLGCTRVGAGAATGVGWSRLSIELIFHFPEKVLKSSHPLTETVVA
jgi:hypothetical protein